MINFPSTMTQKMIRQFKFDDLEAGHLELEGQFSSSDARFSFATGNVTARCVLSVVRQLACLETVLYVSRILPH